MDQLLDKARRARETITMGRSPFGGQRRQRFREEIVDPGSELPPLPIPPKPRKPGTSADEIFHDPNILEQQDVFTNEILINGTTKAREDTYTGLRTSTAWFSQGPLKYIGSREDPDNLGMEMKNGVAVPINPNDFSYGWYPDLVTIGTYEFPKSKLGALTRDLKQMVPYIYSLGINIESIPIPDFEITGVSTLYQQGFKQTQREFSVNGSYEFFVISEPPDYSNMEWIALYDSTVPNPGPNPIQLEAWNDDDQWATRAHTMVKNEDKILYRLFKEFKIKKVYEPLAGGAEEESYAVKTQSHEDTFSDFKVGDEIQVDLTKGRTATGAMCPDGKLYFVTRTTFQNTFVDEDNKDSPPQFVHQFAVAPYLKTGEKYEFKLFWTTLYMTDKYYLDNSFFDGKLYSNQKDPDGVITFPAQFYPNTNVVNDSSIVPDPPDLAHGTKGRRTPNRRHNMKHTVLKGPHRHIEYRGRGTDEVRANLMADISHARQLFRRYNNDRKGQTMTRENSKSPMHFNNHNVLCLPKIFPLFGIIAAAIPIIGSVLNLFSGGNKQDEHGVRQFHIENKRTKKSFTLASKVESIRRGNPQDDQPEGVLLPNVTYGLDSSRGLVVPASSNGRYTSVTKISEMELGTTGSNVVPVNASNGGAIPVYDSAGGGGADGPPWIPGDTRGNGTLALRPKHMIWELKPHSFVTDEAHPIASVLETKNNFFAFRWSQDGDNTEDYDCVGQLIGDTIGLETQKASATYDIKVGPYYGYGRAIGSIAAQVAWTSTFKEAVKNENDPDAVRYDLKGDYACDPKLQVELYPYETLQVSGPGLTDMIANPLIQQMRLPFFKMVYEVAKNLHDPSCTVDFTPNNYPAKDPAVTVPLNTAKTGPLASTTTRFTTNDTQKKLSGVSSPVPFTTKNSTDSESPWSEQSPIEYQLGKFFSLLDDPENMKMELFQRGKSTASWEYATFARFGSAETISLMCDPLSKLWTDHMTWKLKNPGRISKEFGLLPNPTINLDVDWTVAQLNTRVLRGPVKWIGYQSTTSPDAKQVFGWPTDRWPLGEVINRVYEQNGTYPDCCGVTNMKLLMEGHMKPYTEEDDKIYNQPELVGNAYFTPWEDIDTTMSMECSWRGVNFALGDESANSNKPNNNLFKDINSDNEAKTNHIKTQGVKELPNTSELFKLPSLGFGAVGAMFVTKFDTAGNFVPVDPNEEPVKIQMRIGSKHNQPELPSMITDFAQLDEEYALVEGWNPGGYVGNRPTVDEVKTTLELSPGLVRYASRGFQQVAGTGEVKIPDWPSVTATFDVNDVRPLFHTDNISYMGWPSTVVRNPGNTENAASITLGWTQDPLIQVWPPLLFATPTPPATQEILDILKARAEEPRQSTVEKRVCFELPRRRPLLELQHEGHVTRPRRQVHSPLIASRKRPAPAPPTRRTLRIPGEGLSSRGEKMRRIALPEPEYDEEDEDDYDGEEMCEENYDFNI